MNQYHGPKNYFSVSGHPCNEPEHLSHGPMHLGNVSRHPVSETENWFLRPVNQYPGSENHFPVSRR